MSHWQIALIIGLLCAIHSEQYEWTGEPSWGGVTRFVFGVASFACFVYAAFDLFKSLVA